MARCGAAAAAAAADGSRFLLSLPEDVLALISAYLSPADLCNLAAASRRLRSLAASDKLWFSQCHLLLLSFYSPSAAAAHLRRLHCWRGAALPSFKFICKFLRLVRPLLGLWVHQNPELGNVVFAVLGFASVLACRIIPQELAPAGLHAGHLLYSPVFEIVADDDGSPLFFLHGSEKNSDSDKEICDYADYIYPGIVKSVHSNCNVLLLEVAPSAEVRALPPAPRLLHSRSLLQLGSDRYPSSRVIRRSETMNPRSSDPSFGKLGYGDRRKLLEMVATQVKVKVPISFNSGVFAGETSDEEVSRFQQRRLVLLQMYKKFRYTNLGVESDLEAPNMRDILDQPHKWIGEENGNLQCSKRRGICRSFRDGLKQILGRSNSSNGSHRIVGSSSRSSGSSSNISNSRFSSWHASSSSEIKHIQLNEFLKLGDSLGLSLQATKMKLSAYRAWPNMHDNKFALYKLPLRDPSPSHEHAGLWGGTFGWPPGRPSEEKNGRALFFLLLSYEECEGQISLIATKILEGTHYVLHPNGSAMFIVKIDEPSWDPLPWGAEGGSAGMEIKCAYKGEGIANGYGFRYPGSKPGSLFVTQCGLLIFVWNDSRSVLTLQRLQMEEVLRQGEKVQALPPIANFAYLTKSFSNVFMDFWSTTSYLASARK